MKLVTYQVGQKTGVGVISRDGEWVFPIRSIGPEYGTMLEAIKQMSESEKQLLEHASGQEPYSCKGAARLKEVRLLAPVLLHCHRQNSVALSASLLLFSWT